MRLLSFSSGLSICGIADYNRHLMPELARRMDAETVKIPIARASRDDVRGLLALRREFTSLAARADSFDVALVHLVTRYWNGVRPVENMFPAFLNRLKRPMILVLHEWPTIPQVHHYAGALPARLAKRALTSAWLAHEVGQLDYVRWLERDMFRRASRIVVHTTELRDRLTATGIPSGTISVQRFPLHEMPAPAWSTDEVLDRFGLRGKRALLLLGYPIERKGFDLAVRALAKLPPDVVLFLVCPQQDPGQRANVETLGALAREQGVADRLITSDYLDDAQLASVFHAVTMALSPFRSVTGSSSLAHFLAAGVPVVASDLPPIRRALEDGAGIRVFPAGEAGELARVIAGALAEPGALAAMRSANARYGDETSFAALADTIAGLAEDVTRKRRVAP
ncbi:MAG: glycosyltransferase family 4 protein [Deltaproteobacteria bacterium]|nr:glycosyltransferase family 4 protein [Deltaproteobacteria bacterium]